MSFESAYTATMGVEGGYANNPTDRGGETYRGISRKHWPSWNGWSVIDTTKNLPDFPGRLAHIQELQASVRSFYEQNFWRQCGADRVESPEVGAVLFDAAVNHGPRAAVGWWQRALNVCNHRGRRWSDLRVDGDFGPATTAATRTAELRGVLPAVCGAFLSMRGYLFVTLAERDPSQEDFLVGWQKRLANQWHVINGM